MTDAELSTIFLQSANGNRRKDAAACRIEERLQGMVEQARAAWPEIDLPVAEFLRYVAERLPDDQPLDRALEQVHGSDLYLACACWRRDPRALSAFDRTLLSAVSRYVSKIDAAPGFADEIKQQLRKKLFVAEPDAHAKILDYQGRGSLPGWLHVVAVRTARNAIRDGRSGSPRAQDGFELRTATPDPELGYFKAQYGKVFRAAFEKTLSALSAKERSVLRMYFLEGMSSNEIGALYRVTGAAVRFWIKQSREAILDETRRELTARLRVASSELDSIMGLLSSKLDLSISRLLKE
jgi:RNA polymerase sigma-70 factor (ECF subfamily)